MIVSLNGLTLVECASLLFIGVADEACCSVVLVWLKISVN